MPFINDMLAETGANPQSRPAESATPNRTSRFRFEPAEVMAHLRSHIVGQDHVLASIADALDLVKVDIGDPERPLYVALLLGPTGVGKTELVRALSRAIHGRADAFCRIDMNTLAQEHYASALTGAPPGYVGSKEGTTLLDAETIAGSFSAPGIVLFDEIEKASREVSRALLGVLEDGRLTLTAGNQTLDFRNTLIFMTSNLAAAEIQRDRQRQQRGWRRLLPGSDRTRRARLQRIVDRAMLDAFDPEFINRIDELTVFNWLERDSLDGLIDIELRALNQRLARIGYRAELSNALRSLLCDHGFDRRYGARAMGRAFRRHVELPLARTLVDADLRKRRVETLTTLQGEVVSDNTVRFDVVAE